ncbi:hypothetical protein JHK86_054145 [Glycine max]|nr:hypothetical protein JHK86_054145 [Glycine max]
MPERPFVGPHIIFSKLLHIQTTIYVQVGDAVKDHACWERPEDMDTPRSVFKVDKNNLVLM